MAAVVHKVKRVEMDESGELRVVTLGTATLSSDARIVSEETAAKFLDEFAGCIGDPETMLI